MPEYVIEARVVFNMSVTVTAGSPEQAQKKFDAGDWDDDDFSCGAERIDYKATSKPEQVA